MVEVTEALLTRAVKFRQANPKVSGSKSFSRYEKYKKAATLAQVLSLGGTRGDIKNDVDKGFVVFTDGHRTRSSSKRLKEREEEEEEEGPNSARKSPTRAANKAPGEVERKRRSMEEAEDEEEPPKRRSNWEDEGRRTRKKKSPNPYPAEDEPEQARKKKTADEETRRRPKKVSWTEDADDEDPKPRKNSTPKPRDDDDEEEDEEDEEDDEEPEASASSRKTPQSSSNKGAPISKRRRKRKIAMADDQGWFVETVYRLEADDDDGEQFGHRSRAEGPFATKRDAVEAAREALKAEPAFEGWAEEFYGADPAPYDSGDAPDATATATSRVSISVVSQRDREQQKAKADKSAAASLARARARPPPSYPEIENEGKVGEDDTLDEEDGLDWSRFARSPADPELGGWQHAPNLFRKSFVHAVGRIANACYSVAAFARDPETGARYRISSVPGAQAAERVFVPPPGAYKHGPASPRPENLVDAVHTDLFPDPAKCPSPSALEAANLEAAVRAKPNVTHLFVLGLQDDDGLAQALAACAEAPGHTGLECVCLAECAVSAKLLRTLAENAATLKALHLHHCKPVDAGHDDAWAHLLHQAPGLLWCHVSYSSVHDGTPFGRRAFAALPKALRAFGYEATVSAKAFDGNGLQGCLDHLAPAIETAFPALPDLAYVYVFPDVHAASRVTLDPLTLHRVADDNRTSFGFY